MVERGCQCRQAVGAMWGHKWTSRVARGWESLWCADIHGVRADLAQGMPGHMSPLGSFSTQARAEHPGSCEQRGCCLRGARGQHCGQPHCLLGGAGVHQLCPALVWGDGRHRGALLPGIPKGSPMVWTARSLHPPPIPTFVDHLGRLPRHLLGVWQMLAVGVQARGYADGQPWVAPFWDAFPR